MTNKTKDKKEAKRQKEQAIKQQRNAIREALRSAPQPAITEIVLEAPVTENDAHQQELLSTELRSSSFETEQESRVVVEERHSDDAPILKLPSQRKQKKMSWAQLKLKVLTERRDSSAHEVARMIEEHDGNATDPEFTVLLKSIPGTVPVPSHWSTLSEFLSKQADRDSAVGIVPLDIEATDVKVLRASKDPKVLMTMNPVAFVRSFSVGTPLAQKTFGVRLTKPGDVFEEGKLASKTLYEHGKLSKDLREALGMKAATSPPPWIQAVQLMKRLPPSAMYERVPGVNAPIPDGAQWGGGEGMWGHAPRNDNGSPTFPGVMGDVTGVGSHVSVKRPWGSIPPLSRTVEDAPSIAAAVAAAPAAAAAAPPVAAQPAVRKPTIAPFVPTAFQAPSTAAQRTGPVKEMEYIRHTEVVTPGLIATGAVLLPRAPGAPAVPPYGAVPPPYPQQGLPKYPPQMPPHGQQPYGYPPYNQQPPPPAAQQQTSTKF